MNSEKRDPFKNMASTEILYFREEKDKCTIFYMTLENQSQ